MGDVDNIFVFRIQTVPDILETWGASCIRPRTCIEAELQALIRFCKAFWVPNSVHAFVSGEICEFAIQKERESFTQIDACSDLGVRGVLTST